MALNFHPPLCNSANPWATTYEDLLELYESPFTGAVTTRTSLLDGFAHDDTLNQYLFFDARNNIPMNKRSPNANSSLNTLGYSPIPLATYLTYVERIASTSAVRPPKPFIVSVTGTADDVVESYRLISAAQRRSSHPLLMEINLSCPNIPSKPPPAYDAAALASYLAALQTELLTAADETGRVPAVPIGLKTPPYTHAAQFSQLIAALLATISTDPDDMSTTAAEAARRPNLLCPVSFITATNTLGGCLVMQPEDETAGSRNYTPALTSADGTGAGGLGGAAIHALSLGNVSTLRRLLDSQPGLQHVQLLGVGGVSDLGGYERMRAVGAAAVGVGTALGREGVAVFEKIGRDEEVGKIIFGRERKEIAIAQTRPSALHAKTNSTIVAKDR